ncbi:hypothetical protein E2C01_068771 [Portunus trituberculatus]|uniref:Uncharacterized protein n=1 Tax=Portunus trituberculatus TaxID=210409 RepID=A0A5B7HWU1_PORTR|nr:hypothetical protein [Portunus trituberculatus]
MRYRQPARSKINRKDNDSNSNSTTSTTSTSSTPRHQQDTTHHHLVFCIPDQGNLNPALKNKST